MLRSVITLGTFDGVHRGHRAILRQLVQRAKARHAQSVVLAFGMPPRHAGQPRREPVLLTTLDEKKSILHSLGIKRLHVLVFDRKTASTPPERFFADTIVNRFHACEMVVGPRLAFGKDRGGRLPLLRRLGRCYGVRIRVVRPVQGGSAAVSSRRIRALLKRGQVEMANHLLGAPYRVVGRVVRGEGRGRQIGFPTANLEVPADKILPRGVFWVMIRGAEKTHYGLCNVGTRPTFKPRARELHCEVFLFRRPGAPGSRSLYGRKLTVMFLRRIRSERRFSSAQDLAAQIRRDVALARKWM